MSKFFDALETRSADERNSALATRLPQQKRMYVQGWLGGACACCLSLVKKPPLRR